MEWVSFSPVPERPLQYGWKLSFPTPPCHRDRVIVVVVVAVVVVVIIIGCTPPLTIIGCTPPQDISRIRREIRLLTLKGHCSRHSQRICMIKSEDWSWRAALQHGIIKTSIRAPFFWIVKTSYKHSLDTHSFLTPKKSPAEGRSHVET